MHDGQDFVPILYIAGAVRTINEMWNSVQTSKEIQTYLTIVNIKIGRYVISRSEKKSKAHCSHL
jgi:hypothetical protein